MESFLEKLKPVWAPHPGQREFLLAKAKTKVLACGRRWGKTDACAVQTLEAVSRRGPPSRHFLVAPTRPQARILFDRFVALLRLAWDLLEWPFEAYKVRMGSNPEVDLGEHFVTARSGHLPYTLRGFEATHVVVDEAAYVPDELVNDVLWPMMATTDGIMTLISTPHGRNAFWELFEQGAAGQYGVWSRRAPSSENPLVSPSFLEMRRMESPERVFAVEYEAQFLDSEGAVFRKEHLERAFVLDYEETPHGPYFVGVDFARRHDFTVICVLSGDRNRCHLVQMDRFHDIDWSAQITRVADVVKRFPGASLTVDSTGVGDSLAQDLRRVLPRTAIEGFEFRLLSKSELVDRLQSLFEHDAIRMKPNDILRRELERFESEPSKIGPMKYGARSGHDDCVIALALAAWNLPDVQRVSVLLGGQREV